MSLALVLFLLAGNAKENSGDDKIVQGIPVTIEEAPFMVSYGGYCGGTIIAEEWILTSAHCKRRNFIKAKGTTLHVADGEIIMIRRRYEHFYYNPRTFDYDFQLLRLRRKITMDDRARVLKPHGSSSSSDSQVKVFGWGRLREKGMHATSLMTAVVPVRQNKDCEDAMDPYPVTDRMFCAGSVEAGPGVCFGDGGGPAVAGKEVIGLISWGLGCARPNIPALYAKISTVNKWIEITMKQSPQHYRNPRTRKSCKGKK